MAVLGGLEAWLLPWQRDGQFPSLFQQWTLIATSSLDAALLGEGEGPFLRLLFQLDGTQLSSGR